MGEGVRTLPSVCCPITDSSRAEQGRAAHVGWPSLWGSFACINSRFKPWNISQPEISCFDSLCTYTVSQQSRKSSSQILMGFTAGLDAGDWSKVCKLRLTFFELNYASYTVVCMETFSVTIFYHFLIVSVCGLEESVQTCFICLFISEPAYQQLIIAFCVNQLCLTLQNLH